MDRFSYTVEIEGKVATVIPPEPQLEQAARLGDILLEMQQISIASEFGPKDVLSIIEASEMYAKTFAGKLVYIESQPIERVIVKLTKIDELTAFLDKSSLFKEDIIQMRILEKELFVTKQQYDSPFWGTVTLWDLWIFQRLFAFLASIIHFYLEDRNKLFTELHYNSQIPIFSQDSLHDALKGFFGDPKASEIIDLLKWPRGSEHYFDIQAQPIIDAGSFAAIPPVLSSLSALPRNVLVKTKKRFDEDGTSDPIGSLLSEALRSQFSNVYSGLKLHWNGYDLEIDVLAAGASSFYAFECKNTVHPASPFESRSVMDHIEKAAIQLQRFETLFADSDFRTYLEIVLRQRGFIGDLPDSIHSAIVTGPRLLPGYRKRDYTVIPIWELCNFLTDGKISIVVSRADGKTARCYFHLWKADSFDELDLVTALGKNSFWRLRLDSMVEGVDNYPLKDRTLSFKTYHQDMQKFISILEQNYRKVNLVQMEND